MNRIHFPNSIVTKISKIECESNLRYNLKVWQKNNYFDVLNNVSFFVNLVQLMASLGNVNHVISIVEYWIFESNYNKSLCLAHESLDII